MKLIYALLILLFSSHTATAFTYKSCDNFEGRKKVACHYLNSKTQLGYIPAQVLLGLIELGEEQQYAGFTQYLDGLAQGIQIANVYLKEEKKQPIYCAPSNFKPSEQAFAIIEKQIMLDPDSQDDMAQSVLLIGLWEQHKCN